MIEKVTLIKAYKDAKKIDKSKISIQIKHDIDVLIEKIDKNKSLVSAMVTSLVKKICNPKQDIRLHRKDFENGYSARVLDTQVTAPFFKDKFPKYANKESSFLTLATRERIKWTKEEGKYLKIRDKKLKESFLNVFNQVELLIIHPNDYLIYILAKLIELSKIEKALFKGTKLQFKKTEVLNINLIIKMLKEHFSLKQSSRLPVIAIYSIYEILIPKFERYNLKKLLNLQVHTSSDKKGYGDIEVYNFDNQPFEIVEIKHNIPINKYLIFDIAKKTKNIKIDRYYLLTTFENGFINTKSEIEVTEYILKLKKEQGIDIIANGIISTLKYYLRFMDNYQEFINIYTKNLIKDAKQSTEIKNYHIKNWEDLLKKFSIII